MSLSSIKLIAFDLDGTLVDSAPDLALAINAMLNDLGRKTFSADTIRHWVGNGADVLIKRALSGCETISEELDDGLFEKAKPLFLNHYQALLCVDSQLYSGVEQGLAKLAELDVPMVIITNKPGQFTRPLLDALGIEHYFSLVIAGDSLAKKKPDPLPLLHVLKHFNLDASQMLMVGDSKNDIQAAKAAACPSMGLTYGYNYGEDIALSEPDVVADSIGCLGDMIKPVTATVNIN